MSDKAFIDALERSITDLKAKYPHQVKLRQWRERPAQYKKNLIEGQSDGSWVDEWDTRTFGFRQRIDAEAFHRDYGGELL